MCLWSINSNINLTVCAPGLWFTAEPPHVQTELPVLPPSTAATTSKPSMLVKRKSNTKNRVELFNIDTDKIVDSDAWCLRVTTVTDDKKKQTNKLTIVLFNDD